MRTSIKKYNKIMQDYEDAFNESPPLVGAIYKVLTDDYANWIKKAVDDNKVIDLAEYYPKGAHY